MGLFVMSMLSHRKQRHWEVAGVGRKEGALNLNLTIGQEPEFPSTADKREEGLKNLNQLKQQQMIDELTVA